MTKLKIILREQAMNDLEEIWLYTYEAWSLEQADRYHKLIFNEIEFLSTRPEHGKNQNHFRKGYRSSQVKAHLIFYRCSDSEIEIVRILHENMDIPNRLHE
jgi:toxin ParE1/3/4